LLFVSHVHDENRGDFLAQTHAGFEKIVDQQRLRMALLETAHIHQTDGDDVTRINHSHPPHRHADAASTRALMNETHDTGEHSHGRSIDDDGSADPPDLIPERVEHGRGGESGDEDSFRWTAHGLRLRAESVFSGRANRIEPRSHEVGSLPARLLFITWTLLLHFLVDPPP